MSIRRLLDGFSRHFRARLQLVAVKLPCRHPIYFWSRYDNLKTIRGCLKDVLCLLSKVSCCKFSKNEHSQRNFSRALPSLKVSVYFVKLKIGIFQKQINIRLPKSALFQIKAQRTIYAHKFPLYQHLLFLYRSLLVDHIVF